MQYNGNLFYRTCNEVDNDYLISAENQLLASVLLNNKKFLEIPEYLKPNHFLLEHNNRIFALIVMVKAEGKRIDYTTIREFIGDDKILERHVLYICTSPVSETFVSEYAGLIFRGYLKRKLIGAGNTLQEAIINKTAADIISETRKALDEVESEMEHDTVIERVYEVGEKYLKNVNDRMRGEAPGGVKSGIESIDDKLKFFQNSDLIILAGRPAMGKTALVVNIAVNAARDFGVSTLFFSLEMSSRQLTARILSSDSGIPSTIIRGIGYEKGNEKKFGVDDFLKLDEANRKFKDVNLFIDDSADLSINALIRKCKKFKRTEKLGLVVVDYLQLLSGDSRKNSGQRVQELSEITRGLKIVAKDLDVPVIVLSQLSRAVENRDDKRPFLSDLRESGSIEQDADLVLFIYRDSYYKPCEFDYDQGVKEAERLSRAAGYRGNELKERAETTIKNLYEIHERKKNDAELIIAKNRHGEIGKAMMTFDPKLTKFS